MRLLTGLTILVTATLMVMLAPPMAETASAVELLDAELVAAGSPALQNASGTVRLEQGRLDAVGRRVFVVPEPGMLWQLGSGIGLLVLLARRRSRHAEKEDAVTKKRFRLRAPWLAILLMCLATPALAQVPQDMTYTGRLVNERGKALSGPVDLELRVFDAETGGTQLYSEQHLGVPLDPTGAFSVQLGLGTSPSGPFDADLFSDVNRWLEVVVDGEILAPRQIIGSVPWALVAERVAGSGSQVLHVFDATGADIGILSPGSNSTNQPLVYRQDLNLFFAVMVDTGELRPDTYMMQVYYDGYDCTGTEYLLARPRGGLFLVRGVRNSIDLYILLPQAGVETTWRSFSKYFDPNIGDSCFSLPLGGQAIEILAPLETVDPGDFGLTFPFPAPLYVGLAPEPAP